MKNKRIFLMIFLIIFNYISLCFFSFNFDESSKQISLASSKNNVSKSYFASLMQNVGYEIADSNTFNSVYNSFINGLDSVKQSEFYKNSKEYVVRKLFKGKESVQSLLSNHILSNDEDWQRAFKGNMDAVFGFLNKSYYDYASQDNIEYKGNYNNFYFEVVDHYTRDLYFNDFSYTYEYEDKYKSTSSFNDGYILWHYFVLLYGKENDLVNGKLPKGFTAVGVDLFFNHLDNNHKIVTCDSSGDFLFANVNSGDSLYFYKSSYGFYFKDKLTYENLLIHGYKKDDSGNVILDGNCIVVLSAPSYSFDLKKALNDKDNIQMIQRCIEYQGFSGFSYKNLTGIKKVVNKSYNYTFNNPIYNSYIDNSKLNQYVGDNITYNIYSDGDLSSSIDSILDYIDSSDDYLSNYLDYLYTGKIQPKLTEIQMAIDESNRIVVDSKEIIEKLDDLEVDYSKIDDIVKKYTDTLYTKFLDDVNGNLNDINVKVNNIDKEVQVVKSNELDHYLDIKKRLESLHSDVEKFKNSELEVPVKDYTEDFKKLDNRFDELKVAYDSKFDILSEKIDNLDVSKIQYSDEEKGKVKGGVLGFFDFLDRIKNFIGNFFNSTEKINFDAFKDINFKEKFPFSIPFDLVNIFKSLLSEPKVPQFEFKLLTEKITFDFAKFESLAKIIKGFSFLFFVIFIAFKTYDKFGG